MTRKKYKTSTALKNEGFAERDLSDTNVPVMDGTGMSDFWAEIKRQGEALRANPPVIPRNHIWGGDEPKKSTKKRGKK